MQFNQFPTNFPLTDNDTLLLYSDSAQIVTQVKLSVLKAFLGVAATPPPVTAPPLNHVKWYKADNIIQDVNGKVTAFIDQSASANNLTVLAGTPTLVANAINNKNAVKFNVATMRHVAQSYAAKTAFLVYRPNHGNFTDYDGYFAALSSFSDKVPASNEVFDLRGVPGSLKCYSERCTKVYVDNALQSTSAINNYQVGISVGEISRFHLVEMYLSLIHI